MRRARTHCLTTLAEVAAEGWGTTLRMAVLLLAMAAGLVPLTTLLPLR